MNAQTAVKLLNLNRQFYQTFALQFSATRQRLQPGVRGIMKTLPPETRMLDLGCGNGELARELARRDFRGTYVGLDFSPALLQEAQKNLPGSFNAVFIPADLTSADWDAQFTHLNHPTDNRNSLPLRSPPHFTIILAFAVLHHIPGAALRLQLLHQVRGLLAPGGHFIHSEWQFLNSVRLAERIQPWEAVGLTSAEVDPGDYLLDWRHGGSGLRYVHHYSESELAELALAARFSVRESYYADGEGGKLGLYQIWKEITPEI